MASSTPTLGLPAGPSTPEPLSIDPAGDMASIERTLAAVNLNELSLSHKLAFALSLTQLGLHRALQDPKPSPKTPDRASERTRQRDERRRRIWADIGVDVDGHSPIAAPMSPERSTESRGTLPGFDTSDYASLIEVLASALRDASSTGAGSSGESSIASTSGSTGSLPAYSSALTASLARFSTSPFSSSLLGSIGALAGLGSIVDTGDGGIGAAGGIGVDDCEVGIAARTAERDAATSSPEVDPLAGAFESEEPVALQTPPVVAEVETSSAQVPELLLSNLQQLARLLKPSASLSATTPGAPPVRSLFKHADEPFDAKFESLMSAFGRSPSWLPSQIPTPTTATPPKPPAIASLPADLMFRILSLARQLRDEGACECEHGCTTSRGSTQRWALTVALVSKDWTTPARRAAYAHVRIRRRAQLSSLVKLVRTTSPELAEYVRTIDIKVPGLANAAATAAANGGQHPYLAHPRHGRRSIAFPWLSPSAGPSKKAIDMLAPEDEMAALVGACSTLFRLDLSVAKAPFSYSWATLGSAEFLEPGVERALCQAPALRYLGLRQCIDYGELESILVGCPTLEHLRLDAGVDNLDGQDEVLATPHQCRLRSLTLNSYEQSELGERQLVWILAPGVGTLERLDISTCIGLTNAGMGGAAAFAPFGGAAFASLLVELAPTLVRLALKDSLGAGPGVALVNPSLQHLPHAGSFDYALERCVKLRELALDWAFCGPDIIDALSTKPLAALALLGAPAHTSGAMLIECLEAGGFETLDRLALVHFQLGHVQHAAGWSARDVRTLRRVCASRKLEFQFSAV